MATIMLFGSSTIFGVPSEVIEWLNEYNKQGHKVPVRLFIRHLVA